MIDTDLFELENPPDIIVDCYPRFAEVVKRGVAALRQRCDGQTKFKAERDLYKAHLDRILDACGASSVDEVVEKLNGGGR